ncbi:translocating chain-associated membrane protein 1-like 1 isoform X1 [Gymnogyps californianus]|uniref:translocating chain-associated membrane protein 1-like 1 isoform X1 n=1 Tax=Gymnogyps californianus TaxID=33616 RepID=UPI0021C9A1DE|nr:translocating chain-associated membrane protein 1-like 1 isoform X1 [Gymnogyps californianus]
MGLRRKNKSPPVLSHEFVIQNHADTASCLVMGLLLGLMFEVSAKYAIIFIAVQYNVTYTTDDNSEQFHFYDYGPKDIATIFFYMLVAINLHAVIQEYILDKINRRLHLSKTKHSKFNESGQLAFFYLFSFIWGASILNGEEFMMNPTSLWKDYPHCRMLFQVKFFYICQIAYWLHALPELYFQKIRKEDIPRQLCYICLYIAHISGAYILNLQHLGLILMVPHYLVELIFHASRLFYFSDENKQKGFTIWALLFVMVRLLTLTLSVLTFGFGLARVENPGFSIADGNFNVLPVRIGCLGAVCLTQAWMMWKFINFQLKKWREHVKNQIPKKKITNTKNKRTKKEPNRANFVNGAAKLEGGVSPRIRKSKPV